uniref:Uncharacterized protein n=1 Tax=viral metagenome TaxID=1070528 RepID=A0A6C0ADX2_9ZZZZ
MDFYKNNEKNFRVIKEYIKMALLSENLELKEDLMFYGFKLDF